MTRFVLVVLLFQFSDALEAQTISLNYRAAPADNPLKGLVPYEGQGDPFPHSMEFWYFPMDQLMTGSNSFDWNSMEQKLDAISSRGCQAVIRVFMEYPGKKSAVPEFLIKQGVKVTRYTHDGQTNHTPDYNDPKTLAAMKSFIAAFGEQYDGDARIGFVTMGILGHWGEWHTYPRGELFEWKVSVNIPTAVTKPQVSIQVVNPLPTGKPLRFANETQSANGLLSID